MSGHKFKIGQLVNYLSRDARFGRLSGHSATAARRRSVPVSH